MNILHEYNIYFNGRDYCIVKKELTYDLNGNFISASESSYGFYENFQRALEELVMLKGFVGSGYGVKVI